MNILEKKAITQYKLEETIGLELGRHLTYVFKKKYKQRHPKKEPIQEWYYQQVNTYIRFMERYYL